VEKKHQNIQFASIGLGHYSGDMKIDDMQGTTLAKVLTLKDFITKRKRQLAKLPFFVDEYGEVAFSFSLAGGQRASS